MVVQDIKFFYLIVILFCASLSQVKAQPLSNLEFLAYLTDSLLAKVSNEAIHESSSFFKIRSLDTNKEFAWFIENQISNVLKRANINSIYLSQQEDRIDSTEFTVFEFKVITLGIEYTDKKGGGIFGAGKVKRKGNVGLSLRILDYPSGEIWWSGVVEGTRFDWIQATTISQMENVNIAFTQGVYLNGGAKSFFLEPILITGVTGIIIFLFYSLRSR